MVDAFLEVRPDLCNIRPSPQRGQDLCRPEGNTERMPWEKTPLIEEYLYKYLHILLRILYFKAFLTHTLLIFTKSTLQSLS